MRLIDFCLSTQMLVCHTHVFSQFISEVGCWCCALSQAVKSARGHHHFSCTSLTFMFLLSGVVPPQQTTLAVQARLGESSFLQQHRTFTITCWHLIDPSHPPCTSPHPFVPSPVWVGQPYTSLPVSSALHTETFQSSALLHKRCNYHRQMLFSCLNVKGDTGITGAEECLAVISATRSSLQIQSVFAFLRLLKFSDTVRGVAQGAMMASDFSIKSPAVLKTQKNQGLVSSDSTRRLARSGFWQQILASTGRRTFQKKCGY